MKFQIPLKRAVMSGMRFVEDQLHKCLVFRAPVDLELNLQSKLLLRTGNLLVLLANESP